MGPVAKSPSRVARRVRRTQAERRAASSGRLIDATVRALFKHGYGATTVSVVVDEAGASRGAFLHHFPAKSDLMLAVVRHAWELDRRYYLRWFAAVPNPRTRLLDLFKPAWKALSSPTGIAVLEILIACRSDAVLAAAIIPVQLQIQRAARELVCTHVEGAGVPPAEIAQFTRFLEATLRGLAVDLMITKDPSSVAPALALARAAAERLVDEKR